MPDPQGYDETDGDRGGTGRSDAGEHAKRARVQTLAPGQVPSDDPHAPLDVALNNSAGREGLTGTTPSNLYKPLADREQIHPAGLGLTAQSAHLA